MGGIASAVMPKSPASGPMAIISGIRAGKATDRASNQQVGGNERAQAELRDAQAKLNPYMTSGEQSNTMLQDKLASGELGGSFAPGDLTTDPGYQFKLKQGEEALARKQSAAGGYYSGSALKEAQNYGQGLADTTYNDAYNRHLQQQQNLYSMLSGQSAQGLNAAQQYGAYSGDIGKYHSTIGDILANRVVAKENQRMKMMSDAYSGFGGK